MEVQCSYYPCKGVISGKCHCNKNTSFFCTDHLSTHLMQKGPHFYEKIFVSELPQQHEILNSAYGLIQQISKARTKVLQEYQRLQQEIECQTDAVLKTLNELEVLCDNLVKSAAGVTEKDFSKNLYIEYILNLEYHVLCAELNS